MSRAVGEDWESVASNPDPNVDLGYELQSLTVIPVGEDDAQCMVLPEEDDHLADEEFMVANKGAICDLHEHR